MCSLVSRAEIFGDGKLGNGIEDDRRLLAATAVARYQRFFGTIECSGKVKGVALLLNVPSTEKSVSQPMLLTAKHVLPSLDSKTLKDCVYQAGGTPWQPQSLAAEYAWGGSKIVPIESVGQSRVQEFAEDWALVKMSTWKGWENNAFLFSMDDAALRWDEMATDHYPYPAFLIGFDGARGGFMVDLDCEFGFPEPESLIGSVDHLFWDNCDSVPGSSGGVLFEQTGSAPRIAGIRVGNLFDADVHPNGPSPGDKFNLHSNLNLSRTLDQEIVNAMRLLASSGNE